MPALSELVLRQLRTSEPKGVGHLRFSPESTLAGPVTGQPHPSSALRTLCRACGGRGAPSGATRVTLITPSRDYWTFDQTAARARSAMFFVILTA